MFITTSPLLFNLPPLSPVNIITFILIFFAIITASITLSEFPLVDIAIKTSPGFLRASIYLEKTVLKSVSLDHAVKKDESVVKAIEGIGERS